LLEETLTTVANPQNESPLGGCPALAYASPAPPSALRGLVRYGLLSAGSFLITVGGTAFGHEIIGAPEEKAYAIALVVAFIVNFLAMRYYVYDGRRGNAIAQLSLCLASSLAFRGMEYGAFLVVHTWLKTPYALAIVAIQLCSWLVKFFYYRGIVFKSR
jgi:putative flippase GtrA